MQLSPLAPRSSRWLRGGLLILWGLTLGIGFAILARGSPDVAHGIALWSWIFGASNCVRLLMLSTETRSGSFSVLRMACALVGLLSWGQLSWLFLQHLVSTLVAAAGGTGVVALVAATELRAIYRAARDARSDDA